jgi:hypothetical protein
MGKRELVLIAVFVGLGFLVYQFTAPPPLPGAEGISWSGIFRNMKRGVQGARESATVDSQQAVPVPANVKELRINITRPGEITVTGEDPAAGAVEMAGVELHVTARGFDQAEAKAAAAAMKLKVEPVGDAFVVSLDNSAAPPSRNGFNGQIALALKVPRRLTMRIEPHTGRFVASKLAGAEILGARGETRITGFTGRVVITHSAGALELDDLPALKLNARNSRATVKHVSGPITMESIGGEVAISDVLGPLEIEGRNTDIRLESIKALKGPLRINSTGGEIRIDGLRTEARIDGRNTVTDVTLAAPAPVTIYNLGEIRVTAPPGGFALDAVATEGRIRLEDGDLKPSEGTDPRVTGAIRGGGPTLTLRATRGSITLRKPAVK